MKLNKRIITCILLVALVMGTVSPVSAMAAPTVTKKLTITAGGKKTIKVKGTLIISKSFKSSNKKVATVSKKGVVTAKSKGKCKVKVTVKFRKSKKAKTVYKKQFTTAITVKSPKQPDLTETPNPKPTETAKPIETVEPVGTAEPTESPAPPNTGDLEQLQDAETGITLSIHADTYVNWDAVSNVSQFTNESKDFCFAYDGEEYVTVVKTENGAVTDSEIRLKKIHSIFGGVACDDNGNYYLVTGETNEGEDTSIETIFVSKYDKDGNLLATVGDNGSSSLASYYGDQFYTKEPFHSGNCDIAINGSILTVNYARTMYSGHQSNSVFTINTETMKKVNVGKIYQSHCFAERVIPYNDGFVYAGEGDCYNRAFTVTTVSGLDNPTIMQNSGDIFHFWVQENTLNNWDMRLLNNNFAHMGGLTNAGNGNVALVGTSVQALSQEAEQQSEQLFIQIFSPQKDLSDKSSFVTEGVRSGIGGPNGDEAVEDYGVKWLTDFGKSVKIRNPQVVSDGNGTMAILFEQEMDWGEYQGVYCMTINSDGSIIKDTFCLSVSAHLNPCRMPIYSGGKVYWAGNKEGVKQLSVFSFNLK